jgi:hypothetical protein
MFDRGEHVDSIEEQFEMGLVKGRVELWAERLGEASLESALARAMQRSFTDEDDVVRTGLDVYELAETLGIRDPLFPLEDEDEPTSSPVELVGRMLDMVEGTLPFHHDPSEVSQGERALAAARSAIGWTRRKRDVPPGYRVVEVELREE